MVQLIISKNKLKCEECGLTQKCAYNSDLEAMKAMAEHLRTKHGLVDVSQGGTK